MRILKTQNSELVQRLCGLGFNYIMETSNGESYYCFSIDELEHSEILLSQFDTETFFIDNTLSF